MAKTWYYVNKSKESRSTYNKMNTPQHSKTERIERIERIEREALPPLGTIEPSRFVCGEDGVHRVAAEEAAKEAARRGRGTLMFVGDMMFLSEHQREVMGEDGCFDFNASFEYVRKVLKKSDFAMGTLETVVDHTFPYKHELTRIPNGKGEGGMSANCNAPVTCLDAVRYGGIDAVSTANNHALDAGLEGLLITKEHLERYNIIHTGTFRSASEQRDLLIDINGIRVGVLCYTNSVNGMHTQYGISTEKAALHVNRYSEGVSESEVRRDIAKLRERSADYVIVMLHAGIVNMPTPTAKVVKYCRDIANAGADYVLNTHTHTLQGYDVIRTADKRNVPVIWSMGNFVSSMDQAEDFGNRDAIILRIELEKTQGAVIMKDGYIPCFMRRNHEGKRHVTLPFDRAYNGGFTHSSMVNSRKRVQTIMGKNIREVML